MENNNINCEEDEEVSLADLADQLRDFMIEDEAEALGIDCDNPEVTDENRACFYLKAVKACEDELNHINELCDEQIAENNKRVEKFRESKSKVIKNSLNYFKSLLEDYTRTTLKDSKKRSIALPFGTLQLRKVNESFKFDNEDNLINYLKEHNLTSLYKTTEKTSLIKSELNKHLTYDEEKGVLLDGVSCDEIGLDVTHTNASSNFSVKFK